jgi:hypothetical protein
MLKFPKEIENFSPRLESEWGFSFFGNLPNLGTFFSKMKQKTQTHTHTNFVIMREFFGHFLEIKIIKLAISRPRHFPGHHL